MNKLIFRVASSSSVRVLGSIVPRSVLVLLSLVGFVHLAVSSPSPTLVVKNARVIVGDGTVLERGSVVVSGDRIVSVSTDPVDSSGARVIDASGMTVLPGLIDTHVHPLMEKLFTQPRDTAEIRAFLEDRLPARLEAYLEAGITTVMSPGDYAPFTTEVRDRVRSGDLSGPRIYNAGPLLTAPNGHPAATFCGSLDTGGPNPWCRQHLTVEVGTVEQAKAAVADLHSAGVDLIKLVWDPTIEPGVGVLQGDVVKAIVDASHSKGLRSYAHISEHSKAVAAIEFGLDGLVHLPSTPSQPEDVDRLVQLMQEKGVMASTTLTIFDAFVEMVVAQGNQELGDTLSELLAGMETTLVQLAKADPGLVVIGTDSPHLGASEAYHRELELVNQAGLTAEQILQSATGGAARYMGLGDDLGTLEAGKLADILVVEGDPTEDLSALKQVVAVIQGGKTVYETE